MALSLKTDKGVSEEIQQLVVAWYESLPDHWKQLFPVIDVHILNTPLSALPEVVEQAQKGVARFREQLESGELDDVLEQVVEVTADLAKAAQEYPAIRKIVDGVANLVAMRTDENSVFEPAYPRVLQKPDSDHPIFLVDGTNGGSLWYDLTCEFAGLASAHPAVQELTNILLPGAGTMAKSMARVSLVRGLPLLITEGRAAVDFVPNWWYLETVDRWLRENPIQ
jgi:hypothetical protein